jgi:uncharacterized membrane protein
MPKKYDTNPLDPEFPNKIRETQTETLPREGAETGRFPPPSVTEEQTRRFNEANFGAYQSTYNGQNVPANFKTANLADMNQASSRNVPQVGMPEKWLIALPYIPWYIGLVASLIILFVVPKSETKVRFHAAQGLAAHLAILIVSAVLGGLGKVTDVADMGNAIFQVVTMIMLIVFAIKAWKGKPVHIESVDDLTEWLEDKIKPRN